MDNKWIFLCVGLVVGFYICKKRAEAKIENKVQDIAQHIVDCTNKLLDDAIEGGNSVEEVKTEYNRAMYA